MVLGKFVSRVGLGLGGSLLTLLVLGYVAEGLNKPVEAASNDEPHISTISSKRGPVGTTVKLAGKFSSETDLPTSEDVEDVTVHMIWREDDPAFSDDTAEEKIDIEEIAKNARSYARTTAPFTRNTRSKDLLKFTVPTNSLPKTALNSYFRTARPGFYTVRVETAAGAITNPVIFELVGSNNGQFPVIYTLTPQTGQTGTELELTVSSDLVNKEDLTLHFISLADDRRDGTINTNARHYGFTKILETSCCENMTEKDNEDTSSFRLVGKTQVDFPGPCSSVGDCAHAWNNDPTAGPYAIRATTGDKVSNRVIFDLENDADSENTPAEEKEEESEENEGSNGDDNSEDDDNTGSNNDISTATGGQVLGATTQCKVDQYRTAADFIQNKTVPHVVANVFAQVYGRAIVPAESTYWKGRARCDKPTVDLLTRTMRWHFLHNSTGIGTIQALGTSQVSSIFELAYNRAPSASELSYWDGRKFSNAPALLGAMQWHKLFGISH